MSAHPDRVRKQYPEVVTPNVQLHTDVRRLLDYLESEYVSADTAAVLRRLRTVVGYGDAS